MGLIKTGIIAGTSYAAVNKITKAMEKQNQQRQVQPHPPCNCPHCPYSSHAIYGSPTYVGAQPNGQGSQNPNPYTNAGAAQRGLGAAPSYATRSAEPWDSHADGLPKYAGRNEIFHGAGEKDSLYGDEKRRA
ncbi:uncharacterized protein EHS24_003921 [Apiotrichum porosum]|uniref:Uncharacterized protein n=1 Tax=Apiotrichum porosum TaxID=105984 RepID=A0A427XDS8_9TREE|nr:uncharacterized protein EHS24_003921 [Apiotrichum porosum]RSH76982.1 hypothetical protein EHS24_003921 [Apiotrichum porosum]